MSYDLHLFRPPPGADLRAAGEHSFQYEGDGPATPESEARKQRLAAALVAHDPRLRVLPPAEDWRGDPIPPPLELQAADGSGIHVCLFDRTAAVVLPYARGEAVWEQARGYVRVLEEAGGFRAWDPQTGDIFDTGPALPSTSHAEYRRGSAPRRPDPAPSRRVPPLVEALVSCRRAGSSRARRVCGSGAEGRCA